MKQFLKIFIFVIIPLLTFNSCAVMIIQAATAKSRAKKGTSDKKDEKNISERKFTAVELDNLKSSKTLFIIRDKDLQEKEKFVQAVNKSWNFTDIEVVTLSEMENYTDKNYSYFIFTGITTEVTTSTRNEYSHTTTRRSYDHTHIYLTLNHRFKGLDKKGKEEMKSINFCRVELFTDYNTMKLAAEGNPENVVSQIYNEGVLKNWTPGMVSIYLKEVQSHLENAQREFLYDTFKKEEEIEKLKNDTLYVPNYVLTKFNKYSGDEKDLHQASELFKDYPFPYKIINSDDLSNKILDEEIEYVFDYVKSSTENFIRVYSLTNGKIYQGYQALAYNLKSKNIKKIGK